MRETRVTFPELGLIAGTRGMLGAGIGLLLADRLTTEQRKAAGWTLLVVGVLTTVPLAIEMFGRSQVTEETNRQDFRRSTSPAYYG